MWEPRLISFAKHVHAIMKQRAQLILKILHCRFSLSLYLSTVSICLSIYLISLSLFPRRPIVVSPSFVRCTNCPPAPLSITLQRVSCRKRKACHVCISIALRILRVTGNYSTVMYYTGYGYHRWSYSALVLPGQGAISAPFSAFWSDRRGIEGDVVLSEQIRLRCVDGAEALFR